MLMELQVSHFAIIENLHISFRKGLNILSGETGSGKSVLLKSLGLLMGGKASGDMIRTGHRQAVVEGTFDLSSRKDIEERLSESGIECEDNLLIVRRIISSEDKSRVYLNNHACSLNTLREIVAPLIEVTGPSAPLIEMTGQHENRNLLSKLYHLDVLDHFAGTWDKRVQYEEKYIRYQKIQIEIGELQKNDPHKVQRLDFLIYQRDEIVALDLSPGEDQNLEMELKKLRSASKLTQFVDTAENVLYNDDDSAFQRINSLIKKASEVVGLDPAIETKLAPLEQARNSIEDVVYQLRHYMDKMDADPGRLEEIESRLSQIRKLQKKYGSQPEDILRALVGLENEISDLENSEKKIESLKKEQATLALELKQIGLVLHQARKKAADQLTEKVNAELKDLNMKGVHFQVKAESVSEYLPTGSSDVEFMTQTSEKDPLRPLSKFASGGELSRILLSLKKVVGSTNQPRTYLFDEVDTGVSGETAQKVGKKLKTIAKGQQVICVTHLPQVAACGDIHFFIEKSAQKKEVAMEVTELNAKERIQEIARLISGEKITKTSLAHAEQLLN